MAPQITVEAETMGIFATFGFFALLCIATLYYIIFVDFSFPHVAAFLGGGLVVLLMLLVYLRSDLPSEGRFFIDNTLMYRGAGILFVILSLLFVYVISLLM